jgi:hypothetical protein
MAAVERVDVVRDGQRIVLRSEVEQPHETRIHCKGRKDADGARAPTPTLPTSG